ncbi:YncE family protein [Streptomyces sp. BR123]|nr:YncE family protein [Streptomyces sp. BR123]
MRPDGRQVYVANIGSDNVSVISTRGRAVTDTVAVGDGPSSLAVSPGGSPVYVSNFDSDTLSVIDTPRQPAQRTQWPWATGRPAWQRHKERGPDRGPSAAPVRLA